MSRRAISLGQQTPPVTPSLGGGGFSSRSAPPLALSPLRDGSPSPNSKGSPKAFVPTPASWWFTRKRSITTLAIAAATMVVLAQILFLHDELRARAGGFFFRAAVADWSETLSSWLYEAGLSTASVDEAIGAAQAVGELRCEVADGGSNSGGGGGSSSAPGEATFLCSALGSPTNWSTVSRACGSQYFRPVAHIGAAAAARGAPASSAAASASPAPPEVPYDIVLADSSFWMPATHWQFLRVNAARQLIAFHDAPSSTFGINSTVDPWASLDFVVDPELLLAHRLLPSPSFLFDGRVSVLLRAEPLCALASVLVPNDAQQQVAAGRSQPPPSPRTGGTLQQLQRGAGGASARRTTGLELQLVRKGPSKGGWNDAALERAESAEVSAVAAGAAATTGGVDAPPSPLALLTSLTSSLDYHARAFSMDHPALAHSSPWWSSVFAVAADTVDADGLLAGLAPWLRTHTPSLLTVKARPPPGESAAAASSSSSSGGALRRAFTLLSGGSGGGAVDASSTLPRRWTTAAALETAMRSVQAASFAAPLPMVIHDKSIVLAVMGRASMSTAFPQDGPVFLGVKGGDSSLINEGFNPPNTAPLAGTYLTAFNVIITPSGSLQTVETLPAAALAHGGESANRGGTKRGPRSSSSLRSSSSDANGGARRQAAVAAQARAAGSSGASSDRDLPPVPSAASTFFAKRTCEGVQYDPISPAVASHMSSLSVSSSSSTSSHSRSSGGDARSRSLSSSGAVAAVAAAVGGRPPHSRLPIYSEVVVLTQRFEWNIYHWIAEELGKLGPVLDYLKAHPHVRVHLMDLPRPKALLAKFRAEHFAILGLDLVARAVTGYVRARVVHYPDNHGCGFPHAQWAVLLRERLRGAMGYGMSTNSRELAPPIKINVTGPPATHSERQLQKSLRQAQLLGDGSGGSGDQPSAEGAATEVAAAAAASSASGSSSSASSLLSGVLRSLNVWGAGADTEGRTVPTVRHIVLFRRQRHRRITNEMALLHRLRRIRNVTVTEILDWELPDQDTLMRIVASADAIVGAHGAGLANTIVARPGICVVEVMPRFWFVPVYWRLSGQLGLTHHLFVVRGRKMTPIAVDVTRVSNAVSACLEGDGDGGSGGRGRKAMLRSRSSGGSKSSSPSSFSFTATTARGGTTRGRGSGALDASSSVAADASSAAAVEATAAEADAIEGSHSSSSVRSPNSNVRAGRASRGDSADGDEEEEEQGEGDVDAGGTSEEEEGEGDEEETPTSTSGVTTAAAAAEEEEGEQEVPATRRLRHPPPAPLTSRHASAVAPAFAASGSGRRHLIPAPAVEVEEALVVEEEEEGELEGSSISQRRSPSSAVAEPLEEDPSAPAADDAAGPAAPATSTSVTVNDRANSDTSTSVAAGDAASAADDRANTDAASNEPADSMLPLTVHFAAFDGPPSTSHRRSARRGSSSARKQRKR